MTEEHPDTPPKNEKSDYPFHLRITSPFPGHRFPKGLPSSYGGYRSLVILGVSNKGTSVGHKMEGGKRKVSGGLFCRFQTPFFWTPDIPDLCNLENVIHGSPTNTNL